MKFTFTILGCGPSLGVPVPCCSCVTCSSSDPRNTRLRPSAHLLTESGTSILIDASPDIRQQILQYEISRVDALLITHEHADHTLGLDFLRTLNFIQGTPIPVYATPRVLNCLRDQHSYIFNPDPKYIGGGLPQLVPVEIDDMQIFQVKDVPVQPFRMLHGRIKATGFRFGSLAYATDCHQLPEASLELLKGCEDLIIDGLSYKKHATHFSISEAIAIGERIKAERTYLVHMTHHVEYHELEKQTPHNVFAGFDGLKIYGTSKNTGFNVTN